MQQHSSRYFSPEMDGRYTSPMYADRILEYSPKMSNLPVVSPKFEITPIPTQNMLYD